MSAEKLADLSESLTGVINLSGRAQAFGMNALTAARRVHVPVLFGYGSLGSTPPGTSGAPRRVYGAWLTCLLTSPPETSPQLRRLHD